MTMNSIGSQEDLWLLLDHQFHLVTNFLVQDFHLSSAVKNCNVHKNRNAALVSVESARVYLTPKPGVEGSDYINATWLQGIFFSLYKLFLDKCAHTINLFCRVSKIKRVHRYSASAGGNSERLLADGLGS
jgi:hypothetical protein